MGEWAETGYAEQHRDGRVLWRIYYEVRRCPDCGGTMSAEPSTPERVYYHCDDCHRAIRAGKSSYRLEMPAADDR